MGFSTMLAVKPQFQSADDPDVRTKTDQVILRIGLPQLSIDTYAQTSALKMWRGNLNFWHLQHWEKTRRLNSMRSNVQRLATTYCRQHSSAREASDRCSRNTSKTPVSRHYLTLYSPPLTNPLLLYPEWSRRVWHEVIRPTQMVLEATSFHCITEARVSGM